MRLFILENETKIMKGMEEECKFGMMDQNMKDIEKMIKRMEKVD